MPEHTGIFSDGKVEKMLEKVDLSKKMKAGEHKRIAHELGLKLGELQRQARDLKIPVIILFEGWDAAGKGTLINELILHLDPRGFNVNTVITPVDNEIMKPFMWRFWVKTPSRGRIAIFDRSWYSRTLEERMHGNIMELKRENIYNEINSFERQLSDDGNVIVKLFLHISRKEQKKRFKELEENPSTSWKITSKEWEKNKKYDSILRDSEEMIEKTDTGYAPWTIVEAHDSKFAAVKVFNTVVKAIQDKIDSSRGGPTVNDTAGTESGEPKSLNSSVLDRIDLSKTLAENEYEQKIKKYQKRIREIEYEIYSKRLPVIILFEGWDAAGKGGNIRRLTHNMDPRGYEVVPISAPNDVERNHHYLWRFWNAIPKAGHITIFDRTWYGRVLVERVEGFCRPDEWKRAYREINEMEEQLVNYGTVLVKFWLQIDRDEQLRRFCERQETPFKQWKITGEDWRNREKWDLYREAADEMLFRTSTTYAPWTIVESNSKYYARVKTLKTVIDSVEKGLKKTGSGHAE